MHLGDDQEVFKWLASKKRIACGGMEMMNILRLVCAHLGLVLKLIGILVLGIGFCHTYYHC